MDVIEVLVNTMHTGRSSYFRIST